MDYAASTPSRKTPVSMTFSHYRARRMSLLEFDDGLIVYLRMEWCAKVLAVRAKIDWVERLISNDLTKTEHLLDLPLSKRDQSHMHSVIGGHHHDHLNHWLQALV